MSNNESIFRIEKRLKELFGEKKTSELKAMMDADGAIMTGSFVLRGICNLNWSETDIDIVLSNQIRESALKNWLSSNCRQPQIDVDTFLYGDRMCRRGIITHATKYPFYNTHPVIVGSNTMLAGEAFSVEVIEVAFPRDKLHEFVVKNFDFDICKNVYSIVDGVAELFVHNMDAIQKRNCKFEFGGNCITSMERKVKYERRGFRVDCSQKSLLNNIITHQKRTKDDSNARDFKWILTTTDDIEKIGNQTVVCMNQLLDKTRLDSDYLKDFSEIVHFVSKRAMQTCLSCSFSQIGFTHFHIRGGFHIGNNGAENCELIFVSRYEELCAWNTIIDLCIAFHSLYLPSYVLVWIAEFLPAFRNKKNEEFFSHFEVVRLVQNVNEKFRHQRIEKAKKLK
jgi:hypothetical protein